MKSIVLTLLLTFSSLSFGKYSYIKVADDLGKVWGMDFISESEIIFTEKSGQIKILNLKNKKITQLSGVPKVIARGQGGLLDIKLHPNFKVNKRVYFTFSKNMKTGATTALAYGELAADKLVNVKEIFVGKGEASTRRHYGSRIAFSADNKIFFTIGDRGERDNAQKLSNHYGKVMRINDDGTVPSDNPFIKTKGALPEIWSYGHRNPQGLYYDAKSQRLFEMEHGPRGGDEINIVEKGKNYGWPKQSYGKEYMLPMSVGEKVVAGMEQPFKYYVPSIAPCGLIFYEGNVYPELKGSLISGALKLTHLNIVHLESKKEQRLFEDAAMRVRSVSTSPDGHIYFSTDGGKILKLTLKAN